MFANNDSYLRAVRVLMESTNNMANRVKFIQQEVLPYLKSRKSMLDIGIGCGNFTKILLPNFEKASLIDSIKDYLERFEFSGSTQIEKIHGPIEEIDLPKDNYNLSLLSHVLYHVEEHNRPEVLKKTYQATAQEGMVVIIYEDGPLRREVTQHLGKTYFNGEILLEHCRKNFSILEKSTHAYQFNTSNKKEIISICKVYLHDAQVSVEEDELEEYVSKYLEQQRTFNITAKQILIKIVKQ